MPYWQVKGRRPFERASKIAHAEMKFLIVSCSASLPPL